MVTAPNLMNIPVVKPNVANRAIANPLLSSQPTLRAALVVRISNTFNATRMIANAITHRRICIQNDSFSILLKDITNEVIYQHAPRLPTITEGLTSYL